MEKRFVAIWFRHLLTDWHIIRQPSLQHSAFVVAAKDHGRQIIVAASKAAEKEGAFPGMVVADAKAVIPSLQVFDDVPGRPGRLLKGLGEWAIRYTPVVSSDPPDGLLLDVSGCTHLWGGEHPYLKDILTRLTDAGYDVRAAMADTIGTAWAVARYGKVKPIIAPGRQTEALAPLPPAALRLEEATVARLHKLGLHRADSFMHMERPVLRRRFGEALLQRLAQALGQEEEPMQPIQVITPYEERLPCLEPIRTAQGITIAIERLLDGLCARLKKEGKGVRSALLQCYRADDIVVRAEIGTNRATSHVRHLLGLFELQIPTLAPGPGIEVFLLQALKVEDADPMQDKLWATTAQHTAQVVELLDKITGKVGGGAIHRYLPVECHWPEHSFKTALRLNEEAVTGWRTDRPRPVQLLPKPEPIQVTAPVPDYPPMNFRYNGRLHEIRKSDGPERIEREWWMKAGEHRDYYTVEDKEGRRYWVFRQGHYSAGTNRWFLHGFFA